MRIYALYKGDKWLLDGTKQELADYLGVKLRTISFYMSPTYAKRGKGSLGNRLKVEFIGVELGGI